MASGVMGSGARSDRRGQHGIYARSGSDRQGKSTRKMV